MNFSNVTLDGKAGMGSTAPLTFAQGAQGQKEAFVASKANAVWHNLGARVEEATTTRQAIEIAGLDFEVEKSPLMTEVKVMDIDSNGAPCYKTINKVIPEGFATVRKDTHDVLGVVGKDYQVIQNREVFDFFDALTVDKSSGIRFDTAGAIGNGERVFVTAKLPKDMKIGGKDIIENYIFLSTSHDGSGAIMASFTPIRVTCNNILNHVIRKAKKSSQNVLKIRHTQSAKSKMEEAIILMKMCENAQEKMELVFNHWAKIKINDTQLKKYLQIVLAPTPETLTKLAKGEEVTTNFSNIIDKAMNYALTDSAQLTDTTKGTLFGAYNAVTGYYQNVFNFSDEENKAKSVLFGGLAYNRGQKALDLAMNFAEMGEEVLVY